MPLRILGRFDGPAAPPGDFSFAGTRLVAVEGGVAGLALRFERDCRAYELHLVRGAAHGEFPGLPAFVAEGEVASVEGRYRTLRCPSSVEGFVELTLIDTQSRTAMFVGQRLDVVAL
jgi:hypothetical protein